jgi:urea transporter
MPLIGIRFLIALVGGDSTVMECIVVGNVFWDHLSPMTDPTEWVHL